MKYFVSCSFGKDSIATALLALEKGDPIDGLIFCEVMYDHSRNISGEIPEHIAWIRNTAIPRLNEMGLKTIIVKGKKDYLYFFKNAVGGGSMLANSTASRWLVNVLLTGTAKCDRNKNICEN